VSQDKLDQLVTAEDKELLLAALHQWARSTPTTPTRPAH
jgi:monoamine oxidase